jgi:hypothetical protein
MTPFAEFAHAISRTSARVFRGRDGLKMVRIDAKFVPAEMIQNQILRDWSDPQFICCAMSEELAFCTGEIDDAVTVSRAATGPIPANSISVRV